MDALWNCKFHTDFTLMAVLKRCLKVLQYCFDFKLLAKSKKAAYYTFEKNCIQAFDKTSR